MKPIRLIILFSFLLTFEIAFGQGTWTQKADFGGTARWCPVGFSIGTKGYVGVGYDLDSMRSDFWEYDSGLNSWSLKANFGGSAREYSVGFAIGYKGYIGTGTPGFMKDFWEWELVSNIWTQKADFGGTARHDAVGFSIGNKGYIGTGGDSDSSRSDFWEYDPTQNQWFQKANFGGGRRNYAVSFSIGTKGYIGTGGDGLSDKKDFWEYDPFSDVWTQKADLLGVARELSVGFSIGSRGYIGTGAFFNGVTWVGINDFWAWEQSTNTWTQKTDFNGSSRMGAIGFSIGISGYIGTGDDGVGMNHMTRDFWEYKPDTITSIIENKWATLQIYPNPSSQIIIIDASSFYKDEAVTISILNVAGEIVLSEKRSWLNNLSLELGTLDAGIYFVQVANKEKKMIGRFVKE